MASDDGGLGPVDSSPTSSWPTFPTPTGPAPPLVPLDARPKPRMVGGRPAWTALDDKLLIWAVSTRHDAASGGEATPRPDGSTTRLCLEPEDWEWVSKQVGMRGGSERSGQAMRTRWRALGDPNRRAYVDEPDDECPTSTALPSAKLDVSPSTPSDLPLSRHRKCTRSTAGTEAAFGPTDDGEQARDPNLVVGHVPGRPWTRQEDIQLVQARRTLVLVSDGVNETITTMTWAEVARHVPGRGDKACANRWHKIKGTEAALVPSGALTTYMKRSHLDSMKGGLLSSHSKHGQWWKRIKHAQPSGPPRMTQRAWEDIHGFRRCSPSIGRSVGSQTGIDSDVEDPMDPVDEVPSSTLHGSTVRYNTPPLIHDGVDGDAPSSSPVSPLASSSWPPTQSPLKPLWSCSPARAGQESTRSKTDLQYDTLANSLAL